MHSHDGCAHFAATASAISNLPPTLRELYVASSVQLKLDPGDPTCKAKTARACDPGGPSQPFLDIDAARPVSRCHPRWFAIIEDGRIPCRLAERESRCPTRRRGGNTQVLTPMFKVLRTVSLGAGFLTLAACLGAKPITVRLEDPATLVYQGTLSAAANARVFELYEQATPKPRLLKMTSGGGDITLGMELGEWVFRNGLDVEVVDHCFSSCANYVFTAAKAKYLNPDAILMWHGGAYQQSLEEQIKPFGEQGQTALTSWRTREDAFFKTIGVDQSITTYGQTASRPKSLFPYDYSIEDLSKFGVRNVIEKGGVWRWRELRPEFQSQIFRVDVTLPSEPDVAATGGSRQH